VADTVNLGQESSCFNSRFLRIRFCFRCLFSNWFNRWDGKAQGKETNRERIADVWQDTITLLTDTLVTFPIDLIKMISSWAKHAQIFWPSYCSGTHIKFWQLTLDVPNAMPKLVGWQSLRQYVYGWVYYVADGYNGSYYLFWYNRSSFSIFRFDAEKHECTIFCSIQSFPVDLYDLEGVVYGQPDNGGIKLFYLIKRNELWILSFDNCNICTIKLVENDWITFYHTIAVGYLGGVVIIGYGDWWKGYGSCWFYHQALAKWIKLPHLQQSAKIKLTVIDGLITVITNDALFVLKQFTWDNILSDSAALSNSVAPAWEQRPHTRPLKEWILSSAQYNITDNCIAFCEQPTISHQCFPRINDKPPRPNYIATLDHFTWT
jgi:hypothetical protein